jgi:hypothetical protein
VASSLRGPGKPRTGVAPGEILILTAYTHHIADYGRLAHENKERYAKLHGYGFRAVTTGFESSRAPSWWKIKFIEEGFRDYRYVFWTDADALIMNPSVRLESFIAPDYDLHITRALTPFPHIQCGNFLITRSAFSRLFLWLVWNSTAFINHSTWEQAAVNHLMSVYSFRRIKVSPNRLFNSMAAVPDDPDPYQQGDFMVHFPGVPNRAKLMAEYAASAVPAERRKLASA